MDGYDADGAAGRNGNHGPDVSNFYPLDKG